MAPITAEPPNTDSELGICSDRNLPLSHTYVVVSEHPSTGLIGSDNELVGELTTLVNIVVVFIQCRCCCESDQSD